MKKVYYVTKAIVSLPCMGLVPIGVWWIGAAISRADYMNGLLITLLVAAYIWVVWKFCSPTVNPAFVKSAESPGRFVVVNAVFSLIFTALIFFAGACLWYLLRLIFAWLGNEILNLDMSERFEFVWVYFCANSLFQLTYLRLWEYLRKYRWIRRFTIPNVCW